MEKSSLFHADGVDIFQIIENAILLAAFDHPDELKMQRDSIVELLLPPFPQGAEGDENEGLGSGKMEAEEIIRKEQEGKEDRSVVDEVMRIMDILSDHHHQAAEVLLDSLRSLQQLKITYDILETTHIGFAVQAFHKHTGKNIRHLARTVTSGWRKVVDEWVEATDAVVTKVQEEKPVEKKEEMNILEFLSLLENWPNSRIPLAKVQEERSVEEKKRVETRQLPVSTRELHLVGRDGVAKPVKEIKPRGVAKPEPKLQLPLQRKPPSIPVVVQRQSERDEDASVEAKWEVIKRKLHGGDQRPDNAKKQRTMKVNEQPKKGRCTLRPIQKLKNEVREWARAQCAKPLQKQ